MEPQHNSCNFGISTAMENYQTVKNVNYNDRLVIIEVQEDAHFRDKDSVIGQIVKSFGLSYFDELSTDRTLVFER